MTSPRSEETKPPSSRPNALPSSHLLWHHSPPLEGLMASLLEYVGSVHIFLGPYRGNPIALYLRRTESGCQIGPKVYPWNDVMGVGETPNKAAADFEEKWKTKGLTANMYSGPAWEGGIKPERPAPPKSAPHRNHRRSSRYRPCSVCPKCSRHQHGSTCHGSR